MSKGIIGIDVDLTVAPTDDAWYEWLVKVTDYKPPSKVFGGVADKVNFDLSSYWAAHLDSRGIDGLDFFRSADLYDTIPTIPYSKQVIRQLKGEGYEIVFISALKGNHHKSKYRFLERNFPVDGFIGTKEKQYIACDIFIDDRNKLLNTSKASVKIKFETLYTQDEPLQEGIETFNNWLDIYQYIKNLEEK